MRRKSERRGWHRPGIFLAFCLGSAVFVISLFLEQHGISRKYSETGLATILLVSCLLLAFRPVWHRVRFWIVIATIVAVHLDGWIYLANKIERFGFALMFVLVIAEIVLGASAILTAMPEDYQVMADYIYRR